MHRDDIRTQSVSRGLEAYCWLTRSDELTRLLLQQILRANASVKIAADLTTKYRKNVQYNLEATRGNVP